MARFYSLFLGLSFSIGFLEAREAPWQRRDAKPSQTPWSAYQSVERKEQRETFIRSLESSHENSQVEALDSLGSRSENPQDLNQLPWRRFEAEAKNSQFSRLLLWPVQAGYLSSGFGLRSSGFHEGVDIAAPRGTPVRAVASGVVVFDDRLGSYGRTVIIAHGNGYSSLYAHLDKSFVQRGARIKQGVVLGSVGNTGRSDGFHLHFEMRKSGEAVNPLGFSFEKSSMLAGIKGSLDD